MTCSSKNFLYFSMLLLAVAGANGCAAIGLGNSVSWKEEVLQNDGRKILVERTLIHGGRGEIGQSPIKEQTISFVLPDSGKTITWKDEYSEDVGRASFLVLALHIKEQTPYLVVTPHMCLAYNKWGRPNPPYVVFKYDGKAWQRIPLEELPAEFTEINMAHNTIGNEKTLVKEGVVSAEMIKKLKGTKNYPEYMSILRTPLETGKNSASIVDTEVMIPTIDDGWIGIGWFDSKPTYSECLKECRIDRVKPDSCPCDSLLDKKSNWR